MKKISGTIFIKETNSGIPNLIVAIYKSQYKMADVVSGYKKEKENVSKIMGTLGTQVQSIITDKDGSFAFNDAIVHNSGTAEKNNFFIVVFAPEDITDISFPFPLPPEQRILYVSMLESGNLGNEAYIIRLLQAQLDKYQLSPGASSAIVNPKSNSDKIANSIENAYVTQDNLRQKLAPRLQQQYKTSIEIQKKAKEKIKNFNALPLHLKNNPYMLKDPAKLNELQQKTLTDGLKKMKDYKGSMNLSFTSDELKTLQLNPNKDGEIKGKVNTQDLLNIIYAKTGGTNLVRKPVVLKSTANTHLILKKYNIPLLTKALSDIRTNVKKQKGSNSSKK